MPDFLACQRRPGSQRAGALDRADQDEDESGKDHPQATQTRNGHRPIHVVLARLLAHSRDGIVGVESESLGDGANEATREAVVDIIE